jgi:hypothetical protein
LSKGVEKKLSGAEYREKRADGEVEFHDCKKSVDLQKYLMSRGAVNEACKKVKLQLLYHVRNALNLV